MSEEALRGVGPAFGPERIDGVEVLGSGTQGDGLAGVECWFGASQHGQRLGIEGEEKVTSGPGQLSPRLGNIECGAASLAICYAYHTTISIDLHLWLLT